MRRDITNQLADFYVEKKVNQIYHEIITKNIIEGRKDFSEILNETMQSVCEIKNEASSKINNIQGKCIVQFNLHHST